MVILAREYFPLKQNWIAERLAHQVYTYSEQKGYKEGMADALLLLGDVYYRHIDTRKRDKDALESYQQAIKFYEDGDNKIKLANAYKTIGDYYYNLSYLFEEFNRQALRYYLKYLAVAEQSGSKETLAEAYEKVCNLYYELGDESKSMEYSVKVINIRKEIEDKDVNNPHLFTQTKRYYDLQIQNQRLISYAALGGLLLVAFITVLLVINISYRNKAHILLKKQKEEIQKQRDSIEIKNLELNQRNEEVAAQHAQLATQHNELLEAKAELKAANDNLKKMNQGLEEIVEERTQDLRHINEALATANHELDTLIYRASHDFKGPVATLTGLTNLGKMELADSVMAVDFLERIEQVAHKMDGMLEKLHQVSYVIGKDLEISMIHFEEVLEEVKDNLGDMLQTNPIQIDLDIEPNIYYMSDYETITIILGNILENSLLYQNADSPIPSFVKVQIHEGVNQIHIVIRDNGLGIPEKYLPQIFAMFSRFTELAKGNGLGLYVAEKCVEKLGGQIKAESEEGKYTVIYINLPRSRDER
jgi:signal transduction histidine kinase